MYTEDEFGAKIKAKYPEYANIDNATLTKKIVEKYPVYASQIKQPTQSTLSSVTTPVAGGIKSGLGTLGSMIAGGSKALANQAGSAITSFGAEVAKAGLGIPELALKGLRYATNKAGLPGNNAGEILTPYINQFKTQKDFIDTGASEAKRITGGDIGSTIGKYGGMAYTFTAGDKSAPLKNLVAKAPTLTTKIARIPYLGTRTKNIISGTADIAGNALAQGAQDFAKTLAFTGGDLETSKQAGLITGATSGVLRTSGKALSGATQAIAGNSIDIMNRVARVNPNDARNFANSQKKDIGTWLSERNIFKSNDSLIEDLTKRRIEYKNLVDTELEKLQGEYRIPAVDDMINEVLNYAKKTSSKNVKSPLLSEVESVMLKNSERGLNASEINKVKRLFERTQPLGYEKALRGAINPEEVQRKTNIDSAVRQKLIKIAEEQGLKNVFQLNKEIQASKQLSDALIKKAKGSLGNNAIGLTDSLFLANATPESLAGFFTKKIFGSKNVQSKIAKLINKTPKVNIIPENTGTPSRKLLPAKGKSTLGTINLPSEGVLNSQAILRGDITRTNKIMPQSQKIVSKTYPNRIPQQLALPQGNPNTRNPIILPGKVRDESTVFNRFSKTDEKGLVPKRKK